MLLDESDNIGANGIEVSERLLPAMLFDKGLDGSPSGLFKIIPKLVDSANECEAIISNKFLVCFQVKVALWDVGIDFFWEMNFTLRQLHATARSSDHLFDLWLSQFHILGLHDYYIPISLKLEIDASVVFELY